MASPSTPAPPNDERAERLAAALRENLKRRKAQARSRTQEKDAPVDSSGETGG